MTAVPTMRPESNLAISARLSVAWVPRVFAGYAKLRLPPAYRIRPKNGLNAAGDIQEAGRTRGTQLRRHGCEDDLMTDLRESAGDSLRVRWPPLAPAPANHHDRLFHQQPAERIVLVSTETEPNACLDTNLRYQRAVSLRD